MRKIFMKNTFKTLFVLTLLFGMAFTFSSCMFNPTFGLDEVSFEEIAKADLYDKYNYTKETNTYNSDGPTKDHTSDSGTATAAEVKTIAATAKATIEAGKLLKLAEGRVCANKKFKKIVIYVYKNDKDGNRISEVITTYTKK